MNKAQFQPGQLVTWLHEERGGYGYLTPVDADVVKVGKSRIQVRVKKTSGELVIRSVKAESLRDREAFYGRKQKG